MVKRNYIGQDTRNSVTEIETAINNAISDLNIRLKPFKVSCLKRGNKLFLRATLPKTPKDGALTETKRYEISVDSATLAGVSQCEQKALELRQYLLVGNSNWWLLFPGFQQETIVTKAPETMKEIKEKYEQQYWTNREKTRKTLNTWDKSYSDIFLKIPDGDMFNESNLSRWIASTEPNSKPRQDLLRVCKSVAVFLSVDIDWKKHPCKYRPKKRNLPTDIEIENYFLCMPQPYSWAFGMIATYGLRPSELFQIVSGNLEYFYDPQNIRKTLRVPDDTKTGEREVYPLHPEWVQRFDLTNVPTSLLIGNKCLEHKVSSLNKHFHKHGYLLPAYDLRHRYAIRASELAVPVEIASRWMGHSTEEHTRTYQRWISRESHDKIFDKVLVSKSEFSEIEKLRLENQWLREEIKGLKAKLSLLVQ